MTPKDTDMPDAIALALALPKIYTGEPARAREAAAFDGKMKQLKGRRKTA